VFERALARNGVGPLAEEYDVKHEWMVGNFAQAYSHLGLLAAARSLEPLAEARPGPVRFPGGPSGPARKVRARSRPQPCLPIEVAVPLGRVMAWSRGMPADLDALCPSAIVPSGLAHP